MVKVLGAKDMGEESPRQAQGPSHVLSDRMPAEPGPRRFGPDAAHGRASVASTCGDLHVAGGHPHASGRVVPWPRPTVGTLAGPFAGHFAAAVTTDRRCSRSWEQTGEPLAHGAAVLVAVFDAGLSGQEPA